MLRGNAPPTATVPATCTAYLGASKIDTTKNVLTFDTNTKATVGWMTASDCLTDMNASLATEKTGLISAGVYDALLQLGGRACFFDGTYTDGTVQYSTLTYIPDVNSGIVMSCVSQSGTGYSCWLGSSQDSGTTYTVSLNALIPASYITGQGNFAADVSASNPTAAQTTAKGYQVSNLYTVMNGGAWQCKSTKQTVTAGTQVTFYCARFLPTATLATATDPRFDSTKATTFTLWKYNAGTSTGVYSTQTYTPVTKAALGYIVGGSLTAIASLMW